MLIILGRSWQSQQNCFFNWEHNFFHFQLTNLKLWVPLRVLDDDNAIAIHPPTSFSSSKAIPIINNSSTRSWYMRTLLRKHLMSSEFQLCSSRGPFPTVGPNSRVVHGSGNVERHRDACQVRTEHVYSKCRHEVRCATIENQPSLFLRIVHLLDTEAFSGMSHIAD